MSSLSSWWPPLSWLLTHLNQGTKEWTSSQLEGIFWNLVPRFPFAEHKAREDLYLQLCSSGEPFELKNPGREILPRFSILLWGRLRILKREYPCFKPAIDLSWRSSASPQRHCSSLSVSVAEIKWVHASRTDCSISMPWTSFHISVHNPTSFSVFALQYPTAWNYDIVHLFFGFAFTSPLLMNIWVFSRLQSMLQQKSFHASLCTQFHTS